MERWAVTGGNGFLGVHLVRRLAAEGCHVRTLDIAGSDTAAGDGVETIVGDVRAPSCTAALCTGAHVLVHAASALPSRRDASEIRSINVEGTACVLAAAAAAGVRRAIVISSAVVYGLQTVVPTPEEARPAPFDAYGRSKLEAEAVARSFTDRGLESVVLRPSAIVGPGRLGIFGILFRWIREGRRIYTIGPGTNRYQLLSATDLVDAVLRAARQKHAARVYNIGAVQVATVDEELTALIDHAGSTSRIAHLPAPPARIALAASRRLGASPFSAWHERSAGRDVLADASRAVRELGWVATRSSAQALCDAYDWYAANSDRDASGSGITHRASWNERGLGLLRRVS